MVSERARTMYCGKLAALVGLGIILAGCNPGHNVGQPLANDYAGPVTIVDEITPPPPPPPAPFEIDLATSSTVQRALDSNKNIAAAARDVKVKVRKGQATLTGTVPSEQARHEVVSVVSHVPEVDQVLDRLTVTRR